MSSRRGVTLIELLVATTLAVLMTSLAAHVFVTAFKVRGSLREASRASRDLRRAHETVSRDLHSATIPPDDTGMTFGLTSATGSAGVGADVLQFASVVGEPLLAGRAVGETVLIQYAVAPMPNSERRALWRFENAYPVQADASSSQQQERSIMLLPGVRAVTYLFYSEAQQTWVQTWEGEVGLPGAIRFDLALDTGDAEATDEVRQESWIFALPSARYQTEQATAAATAAEAGTTP